MHDRNKFWVFGCFEFINDLPNLHWIPFKEQVMQVRYFPHRTINTSFSFGGFCLFVFLNLNLTVLLMTLNASIYAKFQTWLVQRPDDAGRKAVRCQERRLDWQNMDKYMSWSQKPLQYLHHQMRKHQLLVERSVIRDWKINLCTFSIYYMIVMTLIHIWNGWSQGSHYRRWKVNTLHNSG